MDKFVVNNQIILMRKIIRKTRRNILQNLIKQLKKIQSGKRYEEKDAKVLRLVSSKLEEIKCLKGMNIDDVSKQSLLNSTQWQQVINSPSTTSQDKALAKIASHEWVQKVVKEFKNENPNCDLWLPTLIELWQEKKDIKRKKLADKKSRRKEDRDDDKKIEKKEDEDDEDEKDEEVNVELNKSVKQVNGNKVIKGQTPIEKKKQKKKNKSKPKEVNANKVTPISNVKKSNTSSDIKSSPIESIKKNNLTSSKRKNKEVVIKRIKLEELNSSGFISLDNNNDDENDEHDDQVDQVDETSKGKKRTKSNQRSASKSMNHDKINSEEEEDDVFFLSGKHKQKKEAIKDGNKTPSGYGLERKQGQSGGNRASRRSGVKAGLMSQSSSVKSNVADETLHPSWEARKKLKEKQVLSFDKPMGKKIIFD